MKYWKSRKKWQNYPSVQHRLHAFIPFKCKWLQCFSQKDRSHSWRRHTWAVHTLLKVTNTKVLTKQQNGRSRWKYHEDNKIKVACKNGVFFRCMTRLSMVAFWVGHWHRRNLWFSDKTRWVGSRFALFGMSFCWVSVGRTKRVRKCSRYFRRGGDTTLVTFEMSGLTFHIEKWPTGKQSTAQEQAADSAKRPRGMPIQCLSSNRNTGLNI